MLGTVRLREGMGLLRLLASGLYTFGGEVSFRPSFAERDVSYVKNCDVAKVLPEKTSRTASWKGIPWAHKMFPVRYIRKTEDRNKNISF